MSVVRFKNEIECEHNFFYVNGNDLHLVLTGKSLVEAASIIASADLSEISNVVNGEVKITLSGYTEIVLLHPQEDGVRVGLRRQI